MEDEVQGGNRIEAAAGPAPGEPEASAPLLLQGTVCTQYTRCSKPECHCRDGERHGPYYYRVWRDNGRVRKAYVKREDLAAVQAACALYHQLAQKTTKQKGGAVPPQEKTTAARAKGRRKQKKCSDCGTPAPRHAPDCRWAALIRQLASMGIEVA